MLKVFRRRERSDEEIAATYPIFMAGWREGYPCQGDSPTPAHINRTHPDFKRGLRMGRKECRHLQRSNPELFVNGVLRNELADEQ